MSAAALDAQLTALSTGMPLVVKRPEKKGFPQDFMLHRSEFDRHCRAPCSRSCSRSCAASGVVDMDHRERHCPAKYRTEACDQSASKACTLRHAGMGASAILLRAVPGFHRRRADRFPLDTEHRPGTRGTAGAALHIDVPSGALPGAQRFFGGRVDSRNSSVCSTWTMRPAPGVRMRSKSSSVARRPISEVGWRTVVRAG